MMERPAFITYGLHLVFRGPDQNPLPVLDGIDLQIRDREFFTLLGPSGCGKSTLLAILAGLLTPTAGTVKFHDEVVNGPGPDRGVVHQEDTAFAWYDVLTNVELGMRYQGVPRAERRKKALALIQLVGLHGFEHHLPATLSGGMRQRLVIARSLAADPRALLMDEPFGKLDALTRATLQQELLRIYNETRMLIVFVTHNVAEAVLLSDRVAVMSDRPARIMEILDVDLPRPRSADLRTDQRFLDLNLHLLQLLGAEARS